MVVVPDVNGLSYNIIAEGCDPDFLKLLAAHLARNKRVFAHLGLELDNTFEQLKKMENLIAANRETSELSSRAFLQGLVAYCGELLRTKITGAWVMLETEPLEAYPQRRYFPTITDAQGQTYSFAGTVETELAYLLDPGLNWDKMDGLYHRMRFKSVSPDLPSSGPAGPLFPF